MIISKVQEGIAEALGLFESAGFEVEGIGEPEKFLTLMDAVLLDEDLTEEEYLALEEAYNRLSQAWRHARKRAKKLGFKAMDLWQKASIAMGLKDHPLWKKTQGLNKRIEFIRKQLELAKASGDEEEAKKHWAALQNLHNRQVRYHKKLHRISQSPHV